PAWQRTGAYYWHIISLGLSTGIVGPTLPALAAQTHSGLASLGLAFLVSSAGFTLGTALGSRLIDRVAGHPIIGLAQLAASGLIFLIPFAPQLWLLLAILAGKGIAEGLISAGTNTLLVWVHREAVGPYMNGMHFCFGVGAFTGPLLVAQV